VQSNGLIEKVRTNLALQSETLDNASWTKNRSTITANALVNPVNGATTADYIVEDTATGTHEVIQTFVISAGISYTVSVYAKADTRTKIALVLAGSGFASGGNGQAIFNLSTGVVISEINGATARISDAGNGWYRCSITKASIDTAGVIALELVDASDNTSYTGNGTSRAAFFGAQFEVSDFGATDYIATTTASVSVGPVSGLPRLDYLGSTCPRLLLEPQRTNTSPYSEQFTSGWASSAGSPVTANTTISPSGYQDADTIAETGNGNYLYQSVTTSSGTFTVSVFAKKGSSTNVGIGLVAGGFTSGMSVQFNFDTQTFATPTNHGSFTSISATSQNYGNGWYRLALTGTTATATTYFFVLGSLVGSAYAANVRLWGAQCEAGAYATSYIPTLGASVTRVADACSKTGISSLIGVNGGSIFLELDANGLVGGGAGNYIFDLSDGTNFNANRIAMYWTSANDLSIFYGYGGTTGSVTYNFNFLTTKKVAVRWTSTQIQVVIGGVAQTAVTYGNSSPTKLNIGSRFNDIEHLALNAKQCLLFNTTLTAAQLAELTA
jgi:hypothetical protein